jgi:FADH2 O2-dependent halogenase
MTEVLIVGGGPAGLALGTYLARAGYSCLLFEREHHPRPHVGESILPAALSVLEDLDALDAIEAAGFPRSRGVVYHPQVGFDLLLPYRLFPNSGNERTHTYHVDRARFDSILLQHAHEAGCSVVEGGVVEEVVFEAGRAVGVRVRIGSELVHFDGGIVVDAGGRSTLLGRQLGLRMDHGRLDQIALHGWFTGVDRGRPKTADYSHIYLLPDVAGWAWQAAIDDRVTSVGLVASRDLWQRSKLTGERFFAEAIRGNRKLARTLRHALALRPLRGVSNYSYRLERVCGDGWMAVGDAARFVDPIFSSGVTVALREARQAAASITEGFSNDGAHEAAMKAYEENVFAQTAIWDDFVRLFYAVLPRFTHLLEDRSHRDTIMRMIQGAVEASGSDPSDVIRQIV